jgi:hypothetical protein
VYSIVSPFTWWEVYSIVLPFAWWEVFSIVLAFANPVPNLSPTTQPQAKLLYLFTTPMEPNCCGGGTAFAFEQNFALEDVIGSHACLLDASMHVSCAQWYSSRCSYVLPGDTVHSVQTLKVPSSHRAKELQSRSARCSFWNWILHSRVPLVPTPARFKRASVCLIAFSRASTTSYCSHFL